VDENDRLGPHRALGDAGARVIALSYLEVARACAAIEAFPEASTANALYE
jgi:hypothetical protein